MIRGLKSNLKSRSLNLFPSLSPNPRYRSFIMILFFVVFFSSTEMGTKLSIERRYTAAERSSANEDQVVKMLPDWYSNFPFVNRVFIMTLIIMSLIVLESTV
jgi:hypothetical protein